MKSNSTLVWLNLVMLAALSAAVMAQETQLGKVDFPTSGSPSAQQHFLHGLAALHSFWYEEALEAFREATKADPDFMMGYWGEAMTYNHPLWSEQDTAAARLTISKVKDIPKLDARECAYLNAIKLLYGEGDKRARAEAYSADLEKIYLWYPDDLDAAAFYSLSLLGLGSDGKSYRREAKAGAIALEVYRRNPNHPGAAHYIIHAFDDPDHAILALPAARAYSRIAPSAAHALHMPSHIFVQLGMWDDVVASNIVAYKAAVDLADKKNLPRGREDFHTLSWLQYAYLQQGKFDEAQKCVDQAKTVADKNLDNPRIRDGYASMKARQAV